MASSELLKTEKISFKYYDFYVRGIGKLKTAKAVKQAMELGINVIKIPNKRCKELGVE